MQESGLVELARRVVPDEEILAAGVFAPAGLAEGALGAAGAAGAVASVTSELGAAVPLTIGVHSILQWVTFSHRRSSRCSTCPECRSTSSCTTSCRRC
jgi:hypothetical protein